MTSQQSTAAGPQHLAVIMRTCLLYFLDISVTTSYTFNCFFSIIFKYSLQTSSCRQPARCTNMTHAAGHQRGIT